MLLFIYIKGEIHMIDELAEELLRSGIMVDAEQAKITNIKKHARKNHNKKKLSDDDVRAIRRMLKKGHSYSLISKKYRVHPTTILQIAKNITYKYVI